MKTKVVGETFSFQLTIGESGGKAVVFSFTTPRNVGKQAAPVILVMTVEQLQELADITRDVAEVWRALE